MRPQVPDGFRVEYAYGTQMSKRPPKGETECVETMYVEATLVIDLNDSVIAPPDLIRVAQGRAILNPRDVFSPQVGRDIALGRALRVLYPRLCEQVMVGSGTDVYDPICELSKGHRGPCMSSSAVDQYRLPSPRGFVTERLRVGDWTDAPRGDG